MDASILISIAFSAMVSVRAMHRARVQQVPCLDQTIRRMAFPTKKFDPGNNGNVKRFL